MLAPGTVLSGRYEIVRRLGAGGMGDIYEARQRDLSRRVAIKTLQGDVGADPESFARFRREAEAAAALGHPNIVQVLDFRAEPDEPAYLVMEMLDGRTLHQAIHEDGPMTPHRACFIAQQILSALAAAHAAHIVHRDIKPANVFLVKTLAMPDFVKVLDFGIARMEGAPGRPLTQLGDVLGTTAYMAPEQARGQQVDFRADIFATAAVLFHMLTGALPRELGAYDIQAAGRMPCRRLAELRRTIDPGLGALVDLALSMDPPMRPTAEKLATALERFVTGGTSGSFELSDTIKEAPEKVPVTQAVPARAPSPQMSATAAHPSFQPPAPMSPPMSPPMPMPQQPPVAMAPPPYVAPAARVSNPRITNPRVTNPRVMAPTVPSQRKQGDRRLFRWIFLGASLFVLVAGLVVFGVVFFTETSWQDRQLELATRAARPCPANAQCIIGKRGVHYCPLQSTYATGEVLWTQRATEAPRAVRVVAREGKGYAIRDAYDKPRSIPPEDVLGTPCP